MIDSEGLKRHERRAYAVFMSSLALIVLVLLSGVALGVASRNHALINDVILERGRALFRQIVLTRAWASRYGGVYVPKAGGVESNPWLDHPDIEAADGSVLTLRNPALITREISELASLRDGYAFSITSLKPLNPGNAPDAFERRALASFGNGASEFWEQGGEGDGKVFRYMGALEVEESCLRCHASQGYSLGEVRGGISVSFDISDTERSLRANAAAIVGSALAASALTLGVVYAFVLRLRRKLEAARAELALAATTDGLTGLLNRREAMARLSLEAEKAARPGGRLAVAILDADDFKRINDSHGHAVGDAALKAIAEALRAEARTYDIAARYGGEEFLLAFPGSDAKGALAACERVRAAVTRLGALVLPAEARLSVSVGIAEFPSPETAPEATEPRGTAGDRLDAILKEADEALYAAKRAGKDRCVIHAGSRGID